MGKLNTGEIRPYALILSLIALLGGTFIAWIFSSHVAYQKADNQFQNEADKAAFQIQSRFKNYQLILKQAAASIELLDQNITRKYWQHYIEVLNIRQSMPGTQGLGYSVYIPAKNLRTHEATIQAEGYPQYRVHPLGDRDLYSAIVYLEPFDWRNQRAFGYDMYSEPVRREAMEQARDTNKVTISGRVTLVQETDTGVQQGFLMYAPVYEPGSTPGTKEQRRNLILGNAYAVIRANDMLHGVIGDDHWEYSLTIYDQADSENKGTPIAGNEYHSNSPDSISKAEEPKYSAVRVIDVGGRKWHMELSSTPEYEAHTASHTPRLVAAGGSLMSFLVVGLIGTLYGQGKKIEQRARVINSELQETASRLRVAQKATSFGIWELNFADYSLVWDDVMFDIYDIDKKTFIPEYNSWRDLLLQEDIDSVEKALHCALKEEQGLDITFRIRASGGIKYVRVQAVILRDDANNPTRMIGVNLDVTAEAHARAQEQLAARVFEFAREGILITDEHAKIIDINNTFLAITGYERHEALGKNPSFLQSGLHDKDFYSQVWRDIQQHGYWSGEICNRKKSGETYHELLHISALKDDQDRVRNYIGIFSDITSLKNHERDLQEMATHDSLTGLPNRHYLHARIDELLKIHGESKQKIAFLYLDLDHFKSINDHFGHDAGDRYLREISRRLKIVVQEPHTLARIGGDEFVVIWKYWQPEDIRLTASKLLDRISTPYCDTKIIEPLILSASMGISVYPDDGTDPDILLRQADQAMYQAKQRGRGRVVHFDAKSDQEIEHRMQLFVDIEKGLNNGEFELYYQPKVKITSGNPIGFEGLLRWHHPKMGLLNPGQFLPETESYDIAISIGHWVVRAALEQIKAWKALHIDAAISVNIAAIHLSSEEFIDELDELFIEFGGQTLSQLEIEVLESYPLQNLTQAIEVMNHCVNYGVSFAIDDFGTGYSSLTYMKRLPAETLKIDQSFISDMDTSDDDRNVVKSIIEIASIFHRRIIAEGVETEAQAKLLESMDCEYAQGYYYARPMPAEEAVRWWSDNSS